jgi:hypothetical protein
MHEIWFILVASIITKWRNFKHLTWLQRNPLIILNRLVDLDEILYGGDDIEGDLGATFFNLVALTIP